jgi:hypothetical protein
MNERYVPIAWNAMVDLLKMVTAADGQERSETDAQLWLGVATVQRWRADEAVAAVVQIATTWGRSDVHRARILPGTVDEIIRNNRRQPVAFAAQQAALPPVDEATTDARRAAIAEFVRAQTTRMSVDSAVFDGDETLEGVVADRARGGFRRIDWAAIDACGGCDARGIRLDTPDVVCGHPAQDRRETDVPSGAHTHHDGDIQQQEETDHADDRMGAEAPAAAGDDERGDAAGSAAGRVGAGAQDGR